jgi:hypothetical protein
VLETLAQTLKDTKIQFTMHDGRFFIVTKMTRPFIQVEIVAGDGSGPLTEIPYAGGYALGEVSEVGWPDVDDEAV